MSARLNNILDHIAIQEGDCLERRALKQRLAMASVATQFTVSPQRLQQITNYMLHEMIEGLEGRASTLRMLPSFVYKQSPQEATGVYYALDLGGTNFRVLRVACRRGRVVDTAASKNVIAQSAIQGEAHDLFDFIAKSVKEMMMEKAPEDLDKVVPLGFTFSFPVDLKSVNRGILIKWTKDFATKGVEGNDVVELLQKSFHKLNMNIKVVALCNDTVGTLITHYFEDSDTQLGVILGTGTNASYFERASAVTKDPSVSSRGTDLTPINMECGNFDSKYRHALPVTDYDEALDSITANKGHQQQEKIVSGMYLGEIGRRVLVHLSEMRCLPPTLAKGLARPWCFEAKHLGMISADRMPGKQFTRSLIKSICGVDICEPCDLCMISEVCRLVRNRAAQVSAAICSAPLIKTNVQGRATIAIDGSVFEKTPSFRRVFQRNVNAILGDESDVHAVLARDGSGIGAAFISALVASDAKRR